MTHTFFRRALTVAALVLPIATAGTAMAASTTMDAPAGAAWADVLAATTDNKITPSDAIFPLMNRAWPDVVDKLSERAICNEAKLHHHASASGKATFDLVVTIVNPSTGATTKFAVPIRVSPVPGGKRLAVAVPRLNTDGISRVLNCPT